MCRWAALLLVAPALAETDPSLDTVIQRVRGAYRSGEAMRVMRDVYATDRFFTFPRFHATAEYLMGRMEQDGVGNVELVEAPVVGVSRVGYWTMTLVWEVMRAMIEILYERVYVDAGCIV